MAKRDQGRSSGTGVFMPPSVQAALARGSAGTGCSMPAQQQARPLPRPGSSTDHASPVSTPRSCTSRSSSFSSATSSTCAAGPAALGKPHHHGAQPHVTRPGNSRPNATQQYYDRNSKGTGAAEAGPSGALQGRYGRYSLDESSARLAGGPQSQAVYQTSMQPVWPQGTNLCTSLSTPTALECITAVAGQDAIIVQEDSWASTVSGDVCMLPAGGDPSTVLAGAEALQAMQRQSEARLLLTQQLEQDRLQLQHQHQRQLLRAQLGLMPAAPLQQFANQSVLDSTLLAQMQCSGLAAQNPTSRRRASVGPPMMSPADLGQGGRACSLPVAGMQLPQLVPASSALLGTGVAFSGMDAAATAADAALEVEIDEALRRLLLLCSEVEVSKAQARASCSSAGHSGFFGGAPPAAMVSGSSLAATSQLYQPYNPMAAASGNGPAGNAAQLAAVSATGGGRTTCSSFAPVMSAEDGRGFAPQRLAASAGAAVMCEVRGGAAVPMREASMAEFLGYGMPPAGAVGMQAGLAMPQAAAGQELHLLAMHQAAVGTAGQAYGPANGQVALPLLSQPW